MAEVHATIEETEIENDDGRDVPGVTAECSRCGHETSSYGTGDASRLRCLALLREECPKREANYYSEGEPEPPAAAGRGRDPFDARLQLLSATAAAECERALSRGDRVAAERLDARREAFDEARRLYSRRNSL